MINRKRTHLLALVILVFPILTIAQTAPKPEARKFDEFGDILVTDLKTRLDFFAIQIHQEPESRGFVFTYRSRRDLPGLSARLLAPVRAYLIDSRGIPPERLVTIDGGEASCLAYELWIVPKGAAPTARPDAYSRRVVDSTSTWKYDEYYYGLPVGSDEGVEYFGNSLEGFAEMLRKYPRARGYVITYSLRNPLQRQDPPRIAREMQEHVRTELVRQQRIPPSRIHIVNGGFRQVRQVELWIVGPQGYPPIPTPNAFPGRRR